VRASQLLDDPVFLPVARLQVGRPLLHSTLEFIPRPGQVLLGLLEPRNVLQNPARADDVGLVIHDACGRNRDIYWLPVARLYMRDPSPRRVCNHPLLERLAKEVPVLDWQVIEEGLPAHEARSQAEEANCFG